MKRVSELNSVSKFISEVPESTGIKTEKTADIDGQNNGYRVPRCLSTWHYVGILLVIVLLIQAASGIFFFCTGVYGIGC